MKQVQGHYIEITDNRGKQIGTIEFYYDDEDVKNINLSNIMVQEAYRGKKYAIFMIFCMLHYLVYKKKSVESISLDDSSDQTGTQNTIYYKLGFRIIDRSMPSDMKIYFTKNKEKQMSILEFYNLNQFYYRSPKIAENITIYDNLNHYLNSLQLLFQFTEGFDVNISNIIEREQATYIKLDRTITISAHEVINNIMMKKRFAIYRPASISRTSSPRTTSKSSSISKSKSSSKTSKSSSRTSKSSSKTSKSSSISKSKSSSRTSKSSSKTSKSSSRTSSSRTASR
jgi:hypothetical protein